MIRKASLYIQALFYMFAGLNHFINPQFYLDLIPPYLPLHFEINVFSGFVEVLFGVGLLFNKSRKWAAFGIITMLIAFIPSHVYFIQVDGCIPDGLCAPLWIGWIRLILVHPLLIFWAWNHRK